MSEGPADEDLQTSTQVDSAELLKRGVGEEKRLEHLLMTEPPPADSEPGVSTAPGPPDGEDPSVSSCSSLTPPPGHVLLRALEMLVQKEEDFHFPYLLHQVAEASVLQDHYHLALCCVHLEALYHRRLLDNLRTLQQRWERRCRPTSSHLELQLLDSLRHICQTHSRPSSEDAVCVWTLDCLRPEGGGGAGAGAPWSTASLTDPPLGLTGVREAGAQGGAALAFDDSFLDRSSEDMGEEHHGRLSPRQHNLSEEQQEENLSEENLVAEQQEVNLVKEQQEENLIEEQQEENLSEEQQEENLSEEQQEENLIVEQQEENLSEEQQEENLVEEKQEENLVKEQQEEKLIEEQQEENLVEEQQEENLVKEQQEENLVEEQQEENLSEEQQEENLVEEQTQEEEFEDEAADLMKGASLLDDMAKRITVEEVTHTSGLVSILKRSSVCVERPRTHTAKRRVRFRVSEEDDPEVAGGDSCLLLFLLCLVTVVISVGGTALYCALGDAHSSVCQDFSRNADFYVGHVQSRLAHLQRWFGPQS